MSYTLIFCFSRERLGKMSQSVLSHAGLPDLGVDFRCLKTQEVVSFLLHHDPQWGFVEKNRGVLLGLWVTLPDGTRRSYSNPGEMMDALHQAAFPANGTDANTWFIFHDRLRVGVEGLEIVRGIRHLVWPAECTCA
jgi:hypothetical protein